MKIVKFNIYDELIEEFLNNHKDNYLVFKTGLGIKNTTPEDYTPGLFIDNRKVVSIKEYENKPWYLISNTANVWFSFKNEENNNFLNKIEKELGL